MGFLAGNVACIVVCILESFFFNGIFQGFGMMTSILKDDGLYENYWLGSKKISLLITFIWYWVPLSSTNQFHTKEPLLSRLPNSSGSHQKLSVELRGFWCWTEGFWRLKRRGPFAWNWCVELRGSVWNCDLIILNRSKAKPRLIQRKSFTRFCFWLRTVKPSYSKAWISIQKILYFWNSSNPSTFM